MKFAALWLVIFAVSGFFSSSSATAFMLGSFFGIAWMYWFDND